MKHEAKKMSEMMFRKKSILFFTLFCTISILTFSSTYGADFIEIPGISTSIRENHPRLFLTSDNLTLVRQRAQTTHAVEYGQIVAWCNNNMSTTSESGGDRSRAFAFLYQLNKEGMLEVSGVDYEDHSAQDYGDKAKALFLAHNSSNYNYAIVYDWIHDLFSNSEKQAIFRTWVQGQGVDGRAMSSSDFSGGSVSTIYNGHQVPIGLAMYGENLSISSDYYTNSDEAATAYINAFNRRHKPRIIPAFNLAAGEKGGFGSGLAYDMDYLPGWINVFESWATATGEVDITYTENQRFRKTPYFWLYSDREYPTPSYGYAAEDTRKTWGGYADLSSSRHRIPLALFAQRYYHLGFAEEAGLCQWILENRVSEYLSWQHYHKNPLMIIFHDKSVPARSPEELGLPLIDIFGDTDDYYRGDRCGMGMVFIRQAWNDPDGLVAVFKSSPRGYYGHQGAKDGGFSIAYKGEELALYDSGNYEDGGDHDTVYYDESLSINVVHFHKTGDGSHNKFGGQRLRYAVNYTGVDDANGYPGITKYENTEFLVFAETDLTKNYNYYETRLNSYIRDFIWLKGNPGIFVIFDKIDTADPGDEKRWLLHTVNKPMLDGTSTVLRGDENGGVIESLNTDVIRVDNNTGRLFVKNLVPPNSKTVLVGGEGFRFADTNYVNHPLLKNEFQADLGAWRIETVTNSGASKENFLHILQPADSSTAAMVDTQLINTLNDTLQGALIDQRWAVLFAKDQADINEAQYVLTGTAPVKNILFGCRAATDFGVYDNGLLQNIFTSSDQGLLSFTIDLHSEHNIVITAISNDLNEDGDIDGADLSSFAEQFNSNILPSFSKDFGATAR